MPQYDLKGTISTEHQTEPGKALCLWGDEGWGSLVRKGKYNDDHFSDELVQASVKLVQEWQPNPFPEWVTCAPSLRHPDLVPNFAKRLAEALNLPFLDAIKKTDARPEQKTMANSTQQARNIDGSLALKSLQVPNGPVLLIDDMVDSRWTMTVCAWLLRTHGCGVVFPLALAQSGHEE
jgi:ATP-dependent DNA helicase RecQ